MKDYSILAIDIGNTHIAFGLFSKQKLAKTWKINTEKFLQRKNNPVNSFVLKNKQYIDSIIICSVVPRATERIVSILRKKLSIKPIVVGKNYRLPIKNLYQLPNKVGQDRLVGAYAASTMYGQPLIVVDFGTAITFDVLSKNREYLGGIIIPGMEMSVDGLANKTALLPRVDIRKKPRSLIGKNTADSILSGVYFGLGSLCDGLIRKLKKEVGNCKVISTGGYAGIISQYCKSIDVVEKHLVLKGLEIFYRELIKS